MQPLKVSGLDGFHAIFFQHQWEVLHPSLCSLVQKVFAGDTLDPYFNRTLIALISKTERPKNMKEFRPISLCSIVYKLVTKVLANRLKQLMPELILPYQSSFIKGRNITDNIIITRKSFTQCGRRWGKRGG